MVAIEDGTESPWEETGHEQLQTLSTWPLLPRADRRGPWTAQLCHLRQIIEGCLLGNGREGMANMQAAVHLTTPLGDTTVPDRW